MAPALDSAISPALIAIEGRAPVWGSEFIKKPIYYRGDSTDILPQLNKKTVICVVLRGVLP